MPKQAPVEGSTPLRIALSKVEAAQALSLSVDTLERLTASGQLRSIRVGRRVLFAVKELERWTERSQARRIE